MRAFVTGATGLLGSNIVSELKERARRVTALVRRVEAGKTLGPAVELVKGDLRDATTYELELAKADVLIHAAACYGEHYRTGSRTLPGKTNVQGTTELLQAALRQGVRNVIYVSSAAVLRTQENRATDEASPYADGRDDPYVASKIEAEKYVLDFAKAMPKENAR